MDRRDQNNAGRYIPYDGDRSPKAKTPPWAPSASTVGNDPQVRLDIDFRLGEAATDAKLVTLNGFTKAGSGGIWDPVLGYSPNGTRTYKHTNWLPVTFGAGKFATRALAFPENEFTIYVEVRRRDIAATWLDDSINFIDSGTGPSAAAWNGAAFVPANHPYGDYTGGLKSGHLFYMQGPAGVGFPQIECQYQVTASGQAPVGRFIMRHQPSTADGGSGAAKSFGVRINADVPAFPDLVDPEWITIACAVKGLELCWYIDGVKTARVVRLSQPITVDDVFGSFSIGWNGTASIFRGYIRRFQVACCVPDDFDFVPDLRVCFIGDSVDQRGGGIYTTTPNDPNPLSIAEQDALQNAHTSAVLAATLADNSIGYANPIVATTGRWRPNHWALQMLAANYRRPFLFYTASDSGHGWTSLVNPFSKWIFRAVINYNPHVIVTHGSFNDATSYAHGGLGVLYDELIGDIKVRLSSLVAACPSLRKIILTGTPPFYKGITSEQTGVQYAEYIKQQRYLRDLDGYLGIVEYVDLFTLIGGPTYDPDFNAGSSQWVASWDLAFTRTLTGTDGHQQQKGMNRLAEVVWPSLRDALFHNNEKK